MAPKKQSDAGASGSLVPPALQHSFVGRERELSRLQAALERVIGGSGRLVLLSGAPGIGKTRMAEELARQARELGASVAWGRGWKGQGAPELWPWKQVIRACLRSVDDASLRQLVGPHASELSSLLAAIRGEPAAESPPASPASRFRLFNAIAHLLDRQAARAPLVVILDDLHTADPASLVLLEFFLQEQRERRILTIGIYREPGAEPNRLLTQTVVEAMREPGTERLALAPWSAEESSRFLAARLGVEPGEKLADSLHRRSGGNPFFLAECAHHLAERGAGADVRGDIDDLPIPAELREVIEQRLAHLSPAERAVLQRAAALGNEFAREALDASSSGVSPEIPIAAALAAAERLGLLLAGAQPRSHRFAQGMVGELLREETSAAPCAESVREEARPEPVSRHADPEIEVRSLFRREGEYWTISFTGDTCRLKDARGLAYVAFLLRHPNTPLHATEIVNLGAASGEDRVAGNAAAGELPSLRVGLGDAGAVLDRQAKADYRRRLEELRAELDEARGFNDGGRVARAQHEIDFLTQQLTGAVGLGGRDRKASSPAERARVNVTRSIARAIEKIAESHPELARHLRQTIRTGTFCTYVPDAALRHPWEF